MAGAAYDTLNGKKAELIRKARKGSVFAAPTSSAHITDVGLTDPTDMLLQPLPEGYKDIGWLTDDGAQFSSDIDSSDTSSWGSLSPTRTDLNSEDTTLQVACQETNLTSIGLYVGVASASFATAAANGEVKILKPLQPVKQSYHVVSLAVDENDAGEIYIARYWPNATVTDKDDQAFNKEDEITWPVTFSARPDSTVGFAESWLFGGPGWFSILTSMGFTAAPATP